MNKLSSLCDLTVIDNLRNKRSYHNAQTLKEKKISFFECEYHLPCWNTKCPGRSTCLLINLRAFMRLEVLSQNIISLLLTELQFAGSLSIFLG